MQTEELIRTLANLDMPVFTTGDVASIAGKSRTYIRVYLANLTRRGAIEKIERGKYCLRDTSAYTIASRITENSYIALISAARFYNITTQLPNTILIFSTAYHRPMNVKGGYKVRFIKIGKKMLYGFSEHNGTYVSDIEKIFVDDVYYHRHLSYDEELETTIIRGILDKERLIEYAHMSGNARVINAISDVLNETKEKMRLKA